MNIEFIDIPKIKNVKGNIGVIELNTVPYDIKRVFYLFDVPSSARRGGHAHKNLKQTMIALSGSFDVVLKDGTKVQKVTLNKPDVAMLVHNNIWSELENFSSGAVCMVIASDIYDESDYIRNYKDFKAYVKTLNK